jgi:hypothetical protein
MADEFGFWHPDNTHNPAGLTDDERGVVAECLSYWKNAWEACDSDVLREKAAIIKRASIKIGANVEDF